MTDIAHIKLRLGTAGADAPLILRPWFIGLQILAPAVWIGLRIRRKRAEAFANDPRRRRRASTRAYVRDALNSMRTFAGANDSDAFFATAVRALQEQIGERLDVPATSVTESIVNERLAGAGLPLDVREELDGLFYAANVARYAPVKSTAELNGYLERVERVLAQLEKWEAKP